MRGDDDRWLARASTLAAPLAWGALALLAAHSPWLTAQAPALGALRGPLGVLLGAFALGLTLARVGEAHGAAPQPRPLLLFGLAAAFFLAAGLYYSSRLRVSGDEPHYLLMAQSLWREGDLDLRDNLAREDWREYTPGPVAPHWGAPRADGRPYPAHSPALSVFLAPVYALAGRLGCVAVLALAAAALTVEVHALALRSGLSASAALLAWGAAAGPPVFFYAFHLYTEVPAALALALALRLLLSQPGPVGATPAGLAASALPWLHVKMIPAAAALGLVALLRLRGRPLLAFSLAAGMSAALYLLYFQLVFGRPSPLALYAGMPPQMSGSPGRALAGLFLDRSFGLLPHAPVFLLALAGLPILLRRWREWWPLLLVGVGVLAPPLMWRIWWGGQSPPGRFLVPLVPILAVAAAVRVGEWPRGLSRWAWPLVGIGLALALFASGQPAELLLLNRGDRPTRLWTALSVDVDLGRYLPSLVSATPAEWRVALVWVAGLAVLLVLDRLSRRRTADRLFCSLGFPLALLILTTLAIDHWSRAEEPASPPALVLTESTEGSRTASAVLPK